MWLAAGLDLTIRKQEWITSVNYLFVCAIFITIRDIFLRKSYSYYRIQIRYCRAQKKSKFLEKKAHLHSPHKPNHSLVMNCCLHLRKKRFFKWALAISINQSDFIYSALFLHESTSKNAVQLNHQIHNIKRGPSHFPSHTPIHIIHAHTLMSNIKKRCKEMSS